MKQTYPYSHYIWHLCLLRLVILGPILIIKIFTDVIAGVVDGFYEALNELLPIPWVTKMAEYDKLPEREKKRIRDLEKKSDEIKERMSFQVQKVKSN